MPLATLPLRLILASSSQIRANLLRNAGVPVEVFPARVDEAAILQGLQAEGSRPRDIADTLAEYKARKVGDRMPDALVLGCDQVLAFNGAVLTKPPTVDAARTQLRSLRGTRHTLFSAAVIHHEGRAVWRHVGEVHLTLHPVSDDYLEEYLARNWESIRHAVGSYKLEEEGVRLISAIQGDYFNVLGLPLLPLLQYLSVRGVISS